MRKIFPYILIVLIIVQLFAPFAVGLDVKNNLEVRNNKAEAAGTAITTYGVYTQSTIITVSIRTAWINSIWKANPSVTVSLLDGPDLTTAKIIDSQDVNFTQNVNQSEWTSVENNLKVDTVKAGSVNFLGLIPSKTYSIQIMMTTSGNSWLTHVGKGIFFPILEVDDIIKNDPDSVLYTVSPNPVTQSAGSTATSLQASGTVFNEDILLPVCVLGDWSVGACFGIFLYKVVFQPTSFLFGLTGRLLDVSVAYSVKSSSYTSSFVTEGWGVIRDFCNMFFIFILLYIAFGTILGLHGVKTKEMIINVVIIGLLMNFSLFATQVIIDASNIMTRVFYNSNSIKIGTTTKDGFQEQLGTQDEIKLSEALVAKINPQKLLLNASEVDNIQTNKTLTSTTEKKTGSGVSVSTFILVTILASVVNIVGLITFLSCALLFIARVIGLWLAMIFSPLAFFSYTVPAMQDWEMVGWKKWWPDTLKLAFMAPVFVFFMYLIIKFLDTKLGLAITDQKDGMDFLLGIFIPFIFIMVLLMKAKDQAKQMSGKIGESLTNVVKTAGGLALGGAALGTALLGRQVVGKGLASLSRSDDAMHRATQKIAFNKELTDWETKKTQIKKGTPEYQKHLEEKPDWEKHAEKTKVKGGVFTRIGAKLNEKQMKIGGVDHARHEMDEVKKAAGLEGVENSQLSGVEEKKLQDTFIRTKKSEIESDIRKGYGAKGNLALIDETGKKILGANNKEINGEEEYKKATRNAVEKQYMTDNKILDVKELTDKDRKNIENQLSANFNVVLKATIQKEATDRYGKTKAEAQQKVGGTERLFSRANKGSYDVRDVSGLKSDHREGLLSKVPIALISGIAMGVRSGLKSSGMSGGGIKVEGNFMKDLGNTISDSLKNMKVNVDLSHVGETKSSADAHGGGGGHH